MPLAKELAAELRNFADRLDANPDATVSKGYLFFSHWHARDKESFLNIARAIPRPARKRVSPIGSNPELKISYDNDVVDIYAMIPQALTCKLVEPARPAVYHCDPILSPEEDAELEAKS